MPMNARLAAVRVKESVSDNVRRREMDGPHAVLELASVVMEMLGRIPDEDRPHKTVSEPHDALPIDAA